MRYNQLAASIGTISYKVLTQQLRELEEDGLVCRKVYPEVPPRVEYALNFHELVAGQRYARVTG